MRSKCMVMLAVAALMLIGAMVIVSDDSEAVTTENGEITINGSPIGTYYYDNGALTLTSNSGFEGNTANADLDPGNFDTEDVTSVAVNGYRTDVSIWLTTPGSYTSLDGRITYSGIFDSTGTWRYNSNTKNLLITTSNPSSIITNYGTNNGFFKDYFFRSVPDVEVTLSNYASGGEYLFYGFDLKSFTSPSYSDVTNNKILDNSNVEDITLTSTSFTSIPSGGIFCTSLKGHLKSVTLSNSVTQISSSTFSGFTKLESITAENVSQIGSYAFDGCEKLNEVNMTPLNNIGASEIGRAHV